MEKNKKKKTLNQNMQTRLFLVSSNSENYPVLKVTSDTSHLSVLICYYL